MKTLITALLLSTSLASTATAGAHWGGYDSLDGWCGSLYAIGWDNFSMQNKFDYIMLCKTRGWA